ncbi:MAG: small-conductance mechanosensitive channel, partial [Gammaproteobacteria bacterium]|nr:small-conductance mechanosensitive channel [Gammaproteobacteria bacterium]
MLLQVVGTLGVIAGYFVLYSLINRFLDAFGKKKDMPQRRIV